MILKGQLLNYQLEYNLYPDKTIAFANGGDRLTDNTPEKGFCSAYNIEMLWNIGGGKIQSSSDLIKAQEEFKTNN